MLFLSRKSISENSNLPPSRRGLTWRDGGVFAFAKNILISSLTFG
jgi:hypothetical protein